MEMLPNLRAGRSVKAITCGETPAKTSVSPVNVASAALTTNSHEASPDPDRVQCSGSVVISLYRYGVAELLKRVSGSTNLQ